MMSVTQFFLLFALCVPLMAEAGHKTPHYKLYWRTRGGEIVLSSVCDNYGYGSIDYRGCRAQAKHFFERQCTRYQDKERHSSDVIQARYRRKRQRFCHAASAFGAVN